MDRPKTERLDSFSPLSKREIPAMRKILVVALSALLFVVMISSPTTAQTLAISTPSQAGQALR
jgi:hypothetical protein